MSAFAAAPAAARTAAMFEVSRAADPALIAAVEAGFAHLAPQVEGFKLLQGAELQAVLGWPPEEALTTCGPDVACLAQLGAPATADTVIIVRFVPAPSGSGIQGQFLVVDVASATQQGRLNVDIADAASVHAVLAENFTAIFGVEPPPTGFVVPGEEVELLELEAIAPTESPTAGPAFLNGFFWGGVGAAGVAVVFSVVAAIFGANGQSLAATIDDNMAQTTAVARQREVNQQYDIANGLFVAAGVAGAAAITLGVVAFTRESEATLQVGPGQAALRWRW